MWLQMHVKSDMKLLENLCDVINETRSMVSGHYRENNEWKILLQHAGETNLKNKHYAYIKTFTCDHVFIISCVSFLIC